MSTINKNACPEDSATDVNDITIARVFDAPREQVWKTWTDAELFKKWWGPKDYTAPYAAIDFRVGGKYLYCMRSPEGKDYWSTGVFTEILPFEKFSYTDSFADEKGNVIPASHYGFSKDFPLEMNVTVTFREYEGGQTRLTLRHTGLPGGEMGKLAALGWNESFDKLQSSLGWSK